MALREVLVLNFLVYFYLALSHERFVFFVWFEGRGFLFEVEYFVAVPSQWRILLRYSCCLNMLRRPLRSRYGLSIKKVIHGSYILNLHQNTIRDRIKYLCLVFLRMIKFFSVSWEKRLLFYLSFALKTLRMIFELKSSYWLPDAVRVDTGVIIWFLTVVQNLQLDTL